MLKSFDARIEKLEKDMAKSNTPKSLSDLEKGFLDSEIILINYVTPYHLITSPLMNKYRKRWGVDVWTHYLKTGVVNFGQTCVSDWWNELSKEQQFYLIHGHEFK